MDEDEWEKASREKVKRALRPFQKTEKDPTTRVSDHYLQVRQFMSLAGQRLRLKPELPTLEERKLRARLILEEALETIEALGFDVLVEESRQQVTLDGVVFGEGDELPNLVEVADGCADIAVVTTGTLIACGIADLPLLALVDHNNLAKFGPGSYMDPGGKWKKPPSHQPPKIAELLAEQGEVR